MFNLSLAGEKALRSVFMDARQSYAARLRASRQRSARSSSGGGFARIFVPLGLAVCLLAVLVTLGSAGKDNATPVDNGAGVKSSAKNRDGSKSSSSKSSNGTDTVVIKATYKVKPGDSFAAIAEKQGVTVEQLLVLNPDVDARALQPGQKLKLK